MNNKTIKKVLKKMCKMVNADFNAINFSDKDWFHLYQWTEKEQDEFKKWLIEYMQNNNEACKVLTNKGKNFLKLKKRNKTGFEQFADTFIFWCGWKTKKIK